MERMDRLESQLTPKARTTWEGLTTPAKIQEYLDSIPYSAEERDRCPLATLLDGKAHCLDGALFAAAALRHIGEPPIVVDLLPVPGADDDHVLAVFRHHRRLGAIAKSNFTGLRYREPVYRTLRELVMSYFEDFYNVNGMKTLRAYTAFVQLAHLDRFDWMTTDAGVAEVVRRMAEVQRFHLLTAEMEAELRPLDRRSYEAGLMGANTAGLYKPQV